MQFFGGILPGCFHVVAMMFFRFKIPGFLFFISFSFYVCSKDIFTCIRDMDRRAFQIAVEIAWQQEAKILTSEMLLYQFQD